MMLRKIGIFALISLTIYFGIAAGLILSDRPQPALVTAGEPLAIDLLVDDALFEVISARLSDLY